MAQNPDARHKRGTSTPPRPSTSGAQCMNNSNAPPRRQPHSQKKSPPHNRSGIHLPIHTSRPPYSQLSYPKMHAVPANTPAENAQAHGCAQIPICGSDSTDSRLRNQRSVPRREDKGKRGFPHMASIIAYSPGICRSSVSVQHRPSDGRNGKGIVNALVR